MTSERTSIRGVVETVFYSGPAFSAGRLRTADGAAVKFAGKVFVKANDPVRLEGRWADHPKYGRQFEAEFMGHDLEMSPDGLANFLANHPNIKGIGPAKARLIADRFGAGFDAAIRTSPEAVAAAAKVPVETALELQRIWLANSDFNAAMAYLAAYGLTHHQVTTLVGKFGSQVVPILERDPYVLIREIPGFGFKRVDKIARKMGTPKDLPSRIRAGVQYCVLAALDDGDCWVEYEDLLDRANALLVMDTLDSRQVIEGHLEALIADGILLSLAFERLVVADPEIHRMESELAAILKSAHQPAPHAVKEVERLLDAEGGELNPEQREAVRNALTYSISLMTGGAGSGKTYAVSTITSIAERLELKVVLAAPTGKAAKRLEEVVGHEASTIHRLLGFNGHTYSRDALNPIEADILAIDEVSMVEVPLAWRLFQAIDRSKTAVVLVGDHNQLPPVGPGNLLRDLVKSRAIPTAVLTQIIRQAGTLKENSTAILSGEVRPTCEVKNGARRPWYVINKFTDRDDVRRMLLLLFEEVLGERLGYDLIRDVQVLTPTHKGPLGTLELNIELQRLLQKKLFGFDVPAVEPGHRPRLYPGDKVIQTKNDYELGVMNGAMGVAATVGPRNETVTVQFDDHEVEYSSTDAQELSLAYAVSIHKCVSGDTLIATRSGLRPIRELAQGLSAGEFRGDVLPIAGRSGWVETDQVYAGGVQPTLRVTTRAGYTIEGSHRHPVLVATPEGHCVWRRLPDLRKGDVMVLRRGVSAAGAYVDTRIFVPTRITNPRLGKIPPFINEELGWLLGVLVGDGNQTDRDDGRVEVSKGDLAFLLRAADAAERLLGVKPRVRKRRDGLPSFYFHGRLVREFLAWVGLDYVTAPAKVVPWAILRSPLSVQRSFLRGLFDTDGGVNHLVHFTTTSAQLAFEVQQLLLNHKIISRRYLIHGKDPVRGYSAAYRIDITGDEQRYFRESIGFSHPAKRRRLEDLRAGNEALWARSSRGTIPHGRQLAAELRSEMRRSGGWSRYVGSVGSLLSRIVNGAAHLSIWHARYIVAIVPRVQDFGPAGAEIARIVADGLFFDPVVSIEPAQAEVFDLHVPKGHAFVGNGFVNHNSQGSEFPCAVVIAHKSHSFMHHRNLLYTAVTRAKESVIILGDRWGIENCAAKCQVDRRNTFLSFLLHPEARP